VLRNGNAGNNSAQGRRPPQIGTLDCGHLADVPNFKATMPAIHHLPSRCVLIACLSLASLMPLSASPPAAPVAVAGNDAATGRQLRTRLATDADLKGVVASVENGVAQLGGQVPQAGDRAQAAKIAAGTPGVAKVVDRIDVDTSLRGQFSAAYAQMTGKLAGIVAKAPLLLIGVLILFAAVWLGGVLSRNLHLLRLRTENPYMDGLARRMVKVTVTVIGVLLALNLLDATSLVGAVLGSAGVVGLALGFAFKDIAENYIAGILLSVRKPFSPGEHIRIDNYEGKVVALSSRSTMLMTLDGNQLRLPNALVFKSVLLNYSQNPKRRFDFGFTIDGAQSIRHAQTLALETFPGIEGVLEEPAPSWTVVENSPAGIELRFYGWIDQHASDLGKVRSESIRLVKAAFARAGIESPRTVYHVLTAREPGAAVAAPAPAEPVHATSTDTSVNRDIDDQLADAQRADSARNMLESGNDSA
jgi:small conductance mechanosensitive channel